MSEIHLDEGLDYIQEVIAGITPASALAIGAFTSQTPTTVPARTATFGNGGIVEPAAGVGGYARVLLAPADWNASTTVGQGRRKTTVQKSFPSSSAAWNPNKVNGCFIAVGTTPGVGPVLFAANFDDGLAADINTSGIVLRTIPFWQLDG